MQIRQTRNILIANVACFAVFMAFLTTLSLIQQNTYLLQYRLIDYSDRLWLSAGGFVLTFRAGFASSDGTGIPSHQPRRVRVAYRRGMRSRCLRPGWPHFQKKHKKVSFSEAQPIHGRDFQLPISTPQTEEAPITPRERFGSGYTAFKTSSR